MIHEYIARLINYAARAGLITDDERIWAANVLIDMLRLDSYEEAAVDTAVDAANDAAVDTTVDATKDATVDTTVDATAYAAADPPLARILSFLSDYALSAGLITEDTQGNREAFETSLMGRITPRPAQVIERFQSLYAVSPREATNWFYKFSQDTNYIHRDRIARDIRWSAPSEYGVLDLSINLQKPEIDIRDVVAAGSSDDNSYPKCLLCAQNEGYAGRRGHPARANHRIVPIELGGKRWFLQYSPYVYYNEHCIAFNSEHAPMIIDRSCFVNLMDFLEIFPHYFIGSNADQPIVGGSILSHEHYQGGRYDFAMAKAPVETSVAFPGFPDIRAGIVKWPMSVIRLAGADRDRLTELACRILDTWRAYPDESAGIFPESGDGKPLNTLTPIARWRDGRPELDLVLRNCLTSPEHPLGVFHPHRELHHIKKESIGLIEVMGLAILPPRLKDEIEMIARVLERGADATDADFSGLPEGHREWAADIASRRAITSENVGAIILEEIGAAYVTILEHCGVFKRDEPGKKAFARFIEKVRERASDL